MQPGGGPPGTRPRQDRENTDPHPNPHPTAFLPQRSAALQAASDAKPKYEGADPPVKGGEPSGGDRPAGSGGSDAEAEPGLAGREGGRGGWAGGGHGGGEGVAQPAGGGGVSSRAASASGDESFHDALDALANADGGADDMPLGVGMSASLKRQYICFCLRVALQKCAKSSCLHSFAEIVQFSLA